MSVAVIIFIIESKLKLKIKSRKFYANGKEATLKFSTWNYTRPDYSKVKKKINECKSKMQNAGSYQLFREVWLDVKKEMEYLEFQEEIIYIRHLCGIDYQYSLKEIEIQNKEEPSIYALRDECNRLAVN